MQKTKAILFIFFVVLLHHCTCESLWQQADKKVASGAYDEAVKLYNEALAASYDAKIMYKKAEANYLNKKFLSAVDDTSQLLDKSEADSASLALQGRLLRAKINAMLGNFIDSAKDYSRVLELKPDSKDSVHQLSLVRTAQSQIESLQSHQDKECVSVLGTLTSSIATESIPLRLRRAQCALNLRQINIVQEELKRIFLREKNNIEAMLLHAQSLYKLGAVDMAMKQLKEYLKSDPDNRKIQQLFKSIKKSENILENAMKKYNGNSFREAVPLFESYLESNKDPYNLLDVYSRLCRCMKEIKNFEKGVAWCSKIIDTMHEEANSEQLVDAFLNRAELHLSKDDFEKAEQDASQARQKEQNSQRVMELLQRIQRLKRMAARKNYYKILDVRRDATTDEIKKAYRKLAAKHHPDKFMNADDKKKAETKFKEFTEAYEILKDDERRRRYDNGEDENDQHNGGSPFQHGFHFGGGSPFTFHFGGGGFPF